MEWRKYINGGLTNQTVPDPAPTAVISAPATAIINVPTAAQVAQLLSWLQNCPGGVLPAGIVQGYPFPGNKIPSCMIAPNATALLNAGIFPAMP